LKIKHVDKQDIAVTRLLYSLHAKNASMAVFVLPAMTPAAANLRATPLAASHL
jgi:hypothetical protein